MVEHSSAPPDPWAGYKLCLENLPDCTHVLVIQDDALPVPGFADALSQIATTSPVILWMSTIPAACSARARRAYGKQTMIPLGPTNIVPLVCVLWPREAAAALLGWSAAAAGLTRADDGNVARWMRYAKQEFMVTVPSICEHDDFTPTVKGGRPETQGKDRTRVALFLADDASRYVW